MSSPSGPELTRAKPIAMLSRFRGRTLFPRVHVSARDGREIAAAYDLNRLRACALKYAGCYVNNRIC